MQFSYLVLPLALASNAVRASEDTTSVITTVEPGGGVSVTTSGTTSPTGTSSISTITTVGPGGGISLSTVTTGSGTSASTLSVQPGGPVMSSESATLTIAPSMGPGPVVTGATRTSSGSVTSSVTQSVSQSSASTTGSSDGAALNVPFGVAGLLAGFVGVVVM